MYRLDVIMRRPQTIFFAVLLLCGAFLAINFLPLLASTQTPSGQPLNRQEALAAPLVRFSQANSQDTVDRVLRLSRNGRYDKSASKPFDQLPPEATSSGLVSEWDAYLPALPTAQSDAIILGEILDAGAFLSNDKTGAYSEFTVNVIQVLKDNGSLNDGRLTVERQGARIELPSGRIFDVEVIGQRMPHVGHRYVLFLNYNKETRDYFILTGYELAGDKVFPLDTIQKFTVYENVDAKTFLSDLDAATRHPPAPPIKKEGQQCGLRVLRSRAEADALSLTLEGLGGRTYELQVRTSKRVGETNGVKVIETAGRDVKLLVSFKGPGDTYVRRELLVPSQ